MGAGATVAVAAVAATGNLDTVVNIFYGGPPPDLTSVFVESCTNVQPMSDVIQMTPELPTPGSDPLHTVKVQIPDDEKTICDCVEVVADRYKIATKGM
ncbi:MAG: hypothetical protein KAS59_06605 [Alphaproteobacteria bacterium]|nr:hypothetical protein [Alphaproteobacteria bacterium]